LLKTKLLPDFNKYEFPLKNQKKINYTFVAKNDFSEQAQLLIIANVYILRKLHQTTQLPQGIPELSSTNLIARHPLT